MKASAENRRISLILKMVREKTLVPQPDFQRRSVWTNPDKIAFVETILLGYPFPEIYIAANSVDTVSGDATEILVDGQQRVSTIDSYFRGEKPFKNKTLKAIKRYQDLSESEKRDFLNYEVAVRNLGLLEEPLIREIFRRMNRTSYDLNDMERFNAVYLGRFKRFSERLAEHPFFREHRLFSANDVRRMKDISYVASLGATLLSSYFNRDDEVEEFLGEYNETFEQEPALVSRFLAVFGYIDSLGIPASSRAWRKVDFYTLFVEVDRQLFKRKNAPDIAEAANKLVRFYRDVEAIKITPEPEENVVLYVQASLRNTNDRSQRIQRGTIIQGILESCPPMPFEIEAVPSDSPYLPKLDDEGALVDPGEDDASDLF